MAFAYGQEVIDLDTPNEDGESGEDNTVAVETPPSESNEAQKKRKRGTNREHAHSVLHVRHHKRWEDALHERGIREYEDTDFGRLQKRAQYFPSGKPLEPEDEEWWLKHTPRRSAPPTVTSRVNVSRIKQRRDIPLSLCQVKAGDEVFVSRGKGEGWKGTVVPAHPDGSCGDGTHIKYNRVAVQLKNPKQVQHFKRSRLRNRMIHLTDLPLGWTGYIRLAGSWSTSPSGHVHLVTPHGPFRGKYDDLDDFLETPDITQPESNSVRISCKAAWKTARIMWPYLFPSEDDSDSSVCNNFQGEFCVVCGEGGTLVECGAVGCLESVHTACLEVEPGEHDDWYCEGCKQEHFLYNRTVHTHVECGPGVQYVHKVFGKPQEALPDSRPQVSFELPAILQPPAEYGIGVLCGSSGSGKSLILERRFGHTRDTKHAEWDRNKAIIDLVHPEPEEALERLIAAAIESASDMVKPYHVLSEGQQMRARVAQALRSGVILDEFASCLDYTVVHSLCRGVARFVKEKQLSKVIVASCHPKVVEWLRPDWSYNTDTGVMEYHDQSKWLARKGHVVLQATEAVRSKIALRKGQSCPLGARDFINDDTSDCDSSDEEEEDEADADDESSDASDSEGELEPVCDEERAGSSSSSGATAAFWRVRASCVVDDDDDENDDDDDDENDDDDGMAGSARSAPPRGGSASNGGGGAGSEETPPVHVAQADVSAGGDVEAGDRTGADSAQPRPPVRLKELRARPRLVPGVHFDPSVLKILIEVAHPEVWEMFRTEHYKPSDNIKGAHVYIASLQDHGKTPVGLVAVRPQPGRSNNAATRKHNGWYRESRLVVLKVWQGIGIGCAISDAIATAYKAAGCTYSSCFLHPRLYKHREASEDWIPTSNHMTRGWSCPQPGRKVFSEPKFSYKFIGDVGKKSKKAKKSHSADVDVRKRSSSSEARDERDEDENEESEHMFDVDGSCDVDLDDDHGCARVRICGRRDDESGDDDDGGGKVQSRSVVGKQDQRGSMHAGSESEEEEPRMEQEGRVREKVRWTREEALAETEARGGSRQEVGRSRFDKRAGSGGQMGESARGGGRGARSNTEAGGGRGGGGGEEGIVVLSEEEVSSSEEGSDFPGEEEMEQDHILFVH